MPNLDNPESKKGRESPEATIPTPPGEADVENQTQVSGVGGILRRWRREDLMKKGSLALRGLGLLFSLFAFIIMASNKHGDWKDFDKYEEYRCSLILIYTYVSVIIFMYWISFEIFEVMITGMYWPLQFYPHFIPQGKFWGKFMNYFTAEEICFPSGVGFFLILLVIR